MYQYKGEVISIYDGDTRWIKVDLWFHVSILEKFRLARIDAWEVRWKEKVQWKIARDYCRAKYLWKTVYIKSKKKWKYGRYIADIEFEWEDVSSHLVEQWHAEYKNY